MDKNAFKVKSRRFIELLLCVCTLTTVMAVFFSELIERHRIQSISFFIGVALLLWGIDIRAQEQFVYPIRLFNKKSVIKQKGKSAKIIGAVISIIGVFLSIWGLLFWTRFIWNL